MALDKDSCNRRAVVRPDNWERAKKIGIDVKEEQEKRKGKQEEEEVVVEDKAMKSAVN